MSSVSDCVKPRLGRGVRLRADPARGGDVLLAPERVFTPSRTAIEILLRCDGERSVGAIIDELAAVYAADRARIASDVHALLADLAARRILEL